MKNSGANDYESWQRRLHFWPSIDDFCDDEVLSAGIHRINIGDGPTLDILIEGDLFADPCQAIPTFFNGAISARESKSAPFFSGGRLCAEAGLAYVSVSDPSTSLDQSLGLAWYAGNSYSDLPYAIERCLANIAKATRRHLLLIGGSGGGFAALNIGCRLGDQASVLAWNPQTNILRYNSKFSKNYLHHAFGEEIRAHLASDAWERETQAFLESRSIQFELCTLNAHRPRRMIVFQNASDWHVQSHAAPLIDGWGFEHLGQGRYRLGRDGHLIISNFGSGHEPLPSSVVLRAVQTLMETAKSAEETVNELLQMPQFCKADVQTLPRDLRGLATVIEKDLVLAVERAADDSLQMTVRHNLSPVNYGGMSYSFFVRSSGGSLNRRPFGMENFVELSSADAFSSVMMGVTIRDGFNNIIAELLYAGASQDLLKDI